MREYLRKHENFIIAMVATLAMITVISVCFDYYYQANDDIMIKDILSGVYTGTPESRNVQMHYPMSLFISLLYRIGRNIPWYGLLLCVAHFFSCFYIFLNTCKVLAKTWQKVTIVTIEAMLFMGAMLYEFVFTQYTVTVCMLASAAMFGFFMSDRSLEPKAFIKSNIPNVILIFVAFVTRSEMLLLMFPFICVAGLIKWSNVDRESNEKMFDKGNLIKLAKAEGFKTFYIPDGVGGRFSELCPVGLLPAAVLGIDIKAMLKGAAFMDKLCKSKDFRKNPALCSALLQYLSMKKGKNISVMMPYADSLKYIADWYCQLWGESLGKAVDKDGNTVYAGQTPVKALGVTDQHSQIQLYREGPFDKVITFIAVENFRAEVEISEGCKDFPDVSFLCKHTLSELINTERKATEYALTTAHRSNFTITLPEVNAFTIGELLYYFELETAYTGAMLNIDTFNQPGVEGGKNATYALFGRKGYEATKEEMENAPKKKESYIC